MHSAQSRAKVGRSHLALSHAACVHVVLCCGPGSQLAGKFACERGYGDEKKRNDGDDDNDNDEIIIVIIVFFTQKTKVIL